MSDFFSSLIALQPFASKTAGKQGEKVRGISPTTKDGLYAERRLAPGGKYGPRGALLDANTHALWRLEEVSGTGADEVGVHPLSVVTGSPIGVTGKIGNARQFSTGNSLATNADAAMPLLFDFYANWTVELWLYLSENIPGSQYRGIVVLERDEGSGAVGDVGPEIFIGNLFGEGPKFHVGSSYGRARLGPVIPTNSWNHWAFRCQGTNPTSTITLFLNGALMATSSTTGIFSLAAGTWRWKVGRSIGWTYFNGRLDDIRISTYYRSNAEILATYQRGLGEP